ncbi:hypothetical protein TBLA_0A02040 [Henningerozyma blattae CBS 6284]|uniref:non-specific serine/threonine protein kinase n=1 Tax=Henningerozyma blattae (strain ATCC 34711 / CBS 6284 / DSM 70876 / NBRC 10599 / NRRL Y-10934 / UCD 77-7) TaxID=1071380 RepID=I2GV53_HENB6|nr:hypothetical protein TBLA_0A02040 [Tetrapisispora blattae CBS 6284]CCH58005.1 hypothetical protein TBLA_0A02040 [Tetrapisispora blattae CBS 6284]
MPGIESIIGNKYKIGRKIGNGSFGEIHHAVDLETNESVAVKLEPIRAKNPQLEYESKIYQDLQGTIGIPTLKWFGMWETAECNCMVIDLLGESLEGILTNCERKLSFKTIIQIGIQMLSRIENLHTKNYIHRDIKPDNFLIGNNKTSNIIYMIDFGLTKKYMVPNEDGKLTHIPFKSGKSLTGTARYASINTHIGIEQARRDDLESIGYVLVYLCKGKLPWQGLKGTTKKEKYNEILNKKRSISSEELCKGLPQEFEEYISYCKQLLFNEKPDYQYIKQIFFNLLNRFNYSIDHMFDWILIKKAKIFLINYFEKTNKNYQLQLQSQQQFSKEKTNKNFKNEKKIYKRDHNKNYFFENNNESTNSIPSCTTSSNSMNINMAMGMKNYSLVNKKRLKELTSFENIRRFLILKFPEKFHYYDKNTEGFLQIEELVDVTKDLDMDERGLPTYEEVESFRLIEKMGIDKPHENGLQSTQISEINNINEDYYSITEKDEKLLVENSTLLCFDFQDKFKIKSRHSSRNTKLFEPKRWKQEKERDRERQATKDAIMEVIEAKSNGLQRQWIKGLGGPETKLEMGDIIHNSR